MEKRKQRKARFSGLFSPFPHGNNWMHNPLVNTHRHSNRAHTGKVFRTECTGAGA
jgi:hypothetical protein